MIRAGEEYRALRDGREVWIDGECVQDVTVHPAFKPVVDLKARMYDMAHEAPSADIMSYRDAGERYPILLRPPTERASYAVPRSQVAVRELRRVEGSAGWPR